MTRRVIQIDWNAYGNADIKETFIRRGYELAGEGFDSRLPYDKRKVMLDGLRSIINTFHPDYVFSYHYFPEISNVCEETNVSYIAWIYDSPVFDLYSPTVLNHVNRIFVFDRGVYEEFAAGAIPTVHYMPLGVAWRDCDSLMRQGDSSTSLRSAQNDRYDNSSAQNDRHDSHSIQNDSLTGGSIHNDDLSRGTVQKDGGYVCDVSFIGSMYTEPKHRLYDKFADISPYAHGYLDAIIEAQKHLYGVNILQRFITPEIEAEMQKAYPTDPNSANAMSPAKLYSQFVLSRQVTAIERREIMELLGHYSSTGTMTHHDDCDSTAGNSSSFIKTSSGDNLSIHLYTHDTSLRIPGISNKGPVNYGDGMYRIFASSKINLNITLRSILTGIPLRALDIMSCGGFLLSNFQEELCEYFVPGEDFDYYEDYEDLLNKIDYYLTHEKERRDIARSAHNKIRNEHSLDLRLDAMESYL